MFQPVIIIGAARSGTNMLRDVLTRIPGAGTWPCDEINYIWRHGNAAQPTDEFGPHLARPRVCGYIRRRFSRLARARRLRWVIEKTCANSLRVGFVDRVVPEAKYIFLVRDGRDVTISAMQRWKAPLDIGYVARKARYVPAADLPYYALRYCGNRVYRWVSGTRRLATWGPRFEGMDDLLRNRSLAEVCAAQWARSVRCADYELSRLDSERVFRMKYEDFVRSPAQALPPLLEFLGMDGSPIDVSALVANVSDKSAGNWRRKLSRQMLRQIEPVMHRELQQFGYEAAAMPATIKLEAVAAAELDTPLRRAA